MYNAIYLRKSRNEDNEDDVLSKHRDTLVSICENKGWSYELYEEIASGERIAYRPVMQRLLDDVEQGKYDAVLVMDIDRLGRGNNKDWGTIYECFCNNDYNTLIITPQKTYDLTEDNDEMAVDFQALFAKMEYKSIKKRMMRGKIAGVKQGKWTNGKPPYPYYYDSKTKEVLVDESKLSVYREIIDMFLDGKSLTVIMNTLNLKGYPTPYGIVPDGKFKGWSTNVIWRILVNEVHLGKVIYGKTSGSHSNVKTVSKDRWISVDGSHTPVKTQEEHDKIMRILSSHKRIPSRAKAGTHILSGLLVCGKCGHTMRFMMGNTVGGKALYTICRFSYKDGTKCEQKGTRVTNEFFQHIYNEIVNVDGEQAKKIIEQSRANQDLQDELTRVLVEQSKAKKALTKLYDLYEEDSISKQEFLQRKEKRDSQLTQVEVRISELSQMMTKDIITEKDFIDLIANFKKLWNTSSTNNAKNIALKSIVKNVIYDRNGDSIRLTVHFI